jgi:hypothetical protein
MDISVPISVVWSLVGFVAVAIVNWTISLVKKNQQSKDDTVKRLEEAVNRLELAADESAAALLEFKFLVKSMDEKLADFPRIRKDLNELHSKVREINVLMQK